jgi:hypothetical protein
MGGTLSKYFLGSAFAPNIDKTFKMPIPDLHIYVLVMEETSH